MDNDYKRALVAIDLCQHTAQLLDKSNNIASKFSATIIPLHVVEPSLSSEHIYVDQKKYKHDIIEEANSALQPYFKQHPGLGDELLIKVGDPTNTILATADELDCDLMIIGSHGKHGVKKLLGSTASSITNKCPIDLVVIKHH